MVLLILYFSPAVYESSAKYPGNAVELGNFDLCMSASSEPLGIRGAYALARIQIRGVSDDITPKSPDPEGRERSDATTVKMIRLYYDYLRCSLYLIVYIVLLTIFESTEHFSNLLTAYLHTYSLHTIKNCYNTDERITNNKCHRGSDFMALKDLKISAII